MRSFRAWALVLVAPTVLLCACGGDGAASNPSPSAPRTDALFSEVSADASLKYRRGYLTGTVPAGSTEIFSFCGGGAVGDLDRDGRLDLLITRGSIAPPLLYRNLGNNRFEEIGSTAGLTKTGHQGCGPSFADVDGDGDLDLFIGGFEGHKSYLMLNQIEEGGSLSFVDRTAAFRLDQLTAQNNVSSSFGDYDRDGRLDLFVAHWGTPEGEANQQFLWRNIDGERFESVSASTRLATAINRVPLRGAVRGSNVDYSFLGSFADVSNDGYPDLLVVSDFKTTEVLINQQDSTFVSIRTSEIKDENGMGSAIGDIDNDGDLDWFVTAIFSGHQPGNRFYENPGTGDDGMVRFVDKTTELGVADGRWGWGSCMADFNLDGILDIFHVNGWSGTTADMTIDYSTTNSRLWLSTGAFLAGGLPELRELASRSGIGTTAQGRGVICFDSDNDGDVDILSINNDITTSHFYRNNSSNDKNFLTVELQGLAPNTAAVGARIYLKTGEMEQMREVSIGSNFISHNPTRQYFGLGEASRADELRVEWRDGKTPATPHTVMSNVDSRQHLTISHPQRPASP